MGQMFEILPFCLPPAPLEPPEDHLQGAPEEHLPPASEDHLPPAPEDHLPPAPEDHLPSAQTMVQRFILDGGCTN